jgi:tetratricopeptide (TPR) repeat protein
MNSRGLARTLSCLLTLLVLLCSSGSGICATISDIERAQALIDQGRQSEAVPLLEAAAKDSALATRADLLLGGLFRSQRLLDKAIATLSAGIASASLPQDADPARQSKCELTRAYCDARLWDQADSLIEEVSKSHQDDAQLLRLYLSIKRDDLAGTATALSELQARYSDRFKDVPIRSLMRLLSQAPPVNIASCLQPLFQLACARPADVRDADMREELVRVLEKAGRIDDAARWLTAVRSVESISSDPQAVSNNYLRSGTVYMNAKRYADAAGAFEEAYGVANASADQKSWAKHLAGICYDSAGRRADAETCLRAVIRDYPNTDAAKQAGIRLKSWAAAAR